MALSKELGASVLFFASRDELRVWFSQNHDSASEQWIGFYKKGSGRPSITWPESVDEALCVGWIDGVRKAINAESYKIRFTPRKPASTWSAVNIARVAELTRDGRMQPAGMAAFARRTEARSATYAYENRAAAKLTDSEERQFQQSRAGWAFFEQQPPSYRKRASWWVISAKRSETREKRLARLMAESAAGRRI